jgi:hypothetical protein
MKKKNNYAIIQYYPADKVGVIFTSTSLTKINRYIVDNKVSSIKLSLYWLKKHMEAKQRHYIWSYNDNDPANPILISQYIVVDKYAQL